MTSTEAARIQSLMYAAHTILCTAHSLACSATDGESNARARAETNDAADATYSHSNILHSITQELNRKADK